MGRPPSPSSVLSPMQRHEMPPVQRHGDAPAARHLPIHGTGLERCDHRTAARARTKRARSAGASTEDPQPMQEPILSEVDKMQQNRGAGMADKSPPGPIPDQITPNSQFISSTKSCPRDLANTHPCEDFHPLVMQALPSLMGHQLSLRGRGAAYSASGITSRRESDRS
jgi:hypothetical protein